MDKKLCNLLQRCGYSRVFSLVLASLIGSQERAVMSRDIERDADLRQPPVAIALGALVERGWVTKTPVDKKSSLYKIKDIEVVFNGISAEQQRNILDVKSTLSKLKAAMIPQKKDESQEVQKKELVLK